VPYLRFVTTQVPQYLSYLHNVNKKGVKYICKIRFLVNRTDYNHTAIRI